MRVRRPSRKRAVLGFEELEQRVVPTGPTNLSIPLDPNYDQFGDQIVTVQGYGDYTRTAFGHFDTGASTISFSFADQDQFSNPIPTKTPHGGAVARGIGGPVTGDVSNAGKILADGMHAVSILYGPWGYPVISINYSSSAAYTPGVQAFIGTDTGSSDLPTLTGTPILNPSTTNPNGLAALIDIKGITLDFSFIESGLYVPVSDLTFVAPGTSLAAEPGTTNPVRVPLISFGGDNHLNPGEKVTESYSPLQPEVTLSNGSFSLNHQHFLLDTGAQMSVISTAEAQALGLDLNHPTTSITVQGVAGEAQQVPGFTIDELKLPLADGGALSFTHVPIYVLDLANNLDGLLGMNLFNTAASILYDPFGSAGSSLQLTFFTNPDRNLGNLNQGQLDVLRDRGFAFFAQTVGGQSFPGYLLPAPTQLTATATPIQAATGTAFDGRVASFTSTDPNSIKGNFTAKIAWGDGQSSSGVIEPNAAGGFDVRAQHTYTQSGTFSFTVTINGPDDTKASATSTAEVTRGWSVTATAIMTTPGTAFDGPIASFTSPDPSWGKDDFTATIDWGDSHTSSGTIVANSQGGFNVNGQHTYTNAGHYSFTVTVQGPGGKTASATGTAHVITLTATAAPIVTTPGTSFDGQVASFTSNDADLVYGDFTASINWGDGKTSNGTIAANTQGGFKVTGQHTYTSAGNYSFSVTIQGPGGSGASATGTAHAIALSATGTPFLTTPGVAFTGQVATFTSTDPGSVKEDFSATISWGDGSTSSGTITVNTLGGFKVTGQHTYTSAGSFSFTVTINGPGGSTASATGTAKVIALSATATPFQTTPGTPFTGRVAFFTSTDPGSVKGDFTVTINWGDGNSSTGTIATNTQGGFDVTGQHTYTTAGNYSFTVTIQGPGGSTASATGTAKVILLTATAIPLFTSPGTAFTGPVATFTSTDPGSAKGDFTATINWGDGSTSNGTIDTSTQGGFKVTGQHTYTSAGSYSFTVTINGPGGSTASATGTAKVIALSATATPFQTTPGTPFTGRVAFFTSTDPGLVKGDFTASIAWGDGSNSAGTISANSQSGFDITGQHTYTSAGSYSFTVTINGPGGSTANATSNAKVIALSATATSFQTTPGASFAGKVAFFTSTDPASVKGDFTASIAWGDGNNSSGTVTANPQSGFDITGQHTYANAGSYSFTVTINGPGGSTASATGTAKVIALSATAATIQITPGTAFDGRVASFTSTDAGSVKGDFTASIAWGDGATSSGTISTNTQGGFNVNGQHTYSTAGNYSFTVTISGPGGSTANATGTAEVNTLSATAVSIQTTPNTAFNGRVASFTSTDSGSVKEDFTASIAWGDGATSSGTITANPQGSFHVSGQHTYTTAGLYSFTVTIQGPGGSTASATATAHVIVLTATAIAIQATPGNAFTGQVASFNSTDPGSVKEDFTASIAWGDGSTASGTIAADAQGGFKVNGQHTYPSAGSYSFTVTINGPGGSTASATATAKVTSLSASATAFETTPGVAFSGAVASFTSTDPGSVKDDFSASITWGDGNTSAGTIATNSQGGFEVRGQHTYTQAAPFSFTVTIQGPGGSTASASGTATVIALSATGVVVQTTPGKAFDGAVASFTCTDPGAVKDDFTANINWGDGSSSDGIIVANTYWGFDVRGQHTYTQAGNFSLTVTIQGPGGSSAVATGTAKVIALSATANDLEATKGLVFTETVATFTCTDPGAVKGDFTATITWGDGGTSAGTIAANSQGGFEVSGQHTYNTTGTFSFSVTIQGPAGCSASAIGTAHVSALSATAVSFKTTPGQAFVGRVAFFTSPDPSWGKNDFTASISWGDGNTSPGTIVANLQGGFDVRGQHTYNKAGSFPFSVTIDGPGGISASPIATAKVIALTATAGSIVTTPGQTFNGQVAYIRCTDPDSIKGEFSATIAWGDGTTSAGTITSVSKGSFNVNGLNRYFTAGSYSFMVTIRGPGGSSTTASGTAEVLALGTTGANLQTIPGQLFNDVVATFSSTSPLSVPGDFTATISWGDGLTSRGIIEPRTQGVFAVRGQHLYRQVGTYSILVAIHGPNDSLVRARSTAALAGWADDFQRPNRDFLARPWEETSGRWTINNNSLVAMDPGSNLAVVTGAPLTDGSVQVDFTLGSSSASYVGLVSRNASPGNLYLGEIMAVNGTYTAYLFRCLGGTWTQLATAPVGNSSGALRLENVGTSLKLFLDGQLLVYAFDSNLANGLAGVGASGGTRLDDFIARAIYLNQVTLPFGDTFSQATGSSLSRSWVEQQGNFSVQAGGLRANDPGVNLATVNQVPTSDMAVEASLVLGSAGWGGVVAALSGPGQSNMYGAILSRSASSYKVTLFRNRGGSWVELASAAAGADNGRLRLEVAGKTLKLSFNGNLVATVQVDQPLGPGQAGLWSGSGTLFSDFQVS